jgi:hypothetical protein
LHAAPLPLRHRANDKYSSLDASGAPDSAVASPLLYPVQVKDVLGKPTHAADERQEKLTRAILKYCVEHPDAKDTVDGILRWWFPAGEGHWRAGEVKSALKTLTAKGWMTSRKVQQAEEIYGISKEKITEIEKVLSGSADAAKEPIR